MVHLTAEDLHTLMDCKDQIRNISVIGHCAHGKTSLTESLKSAAGSYALVVSDVREPTTRTLEADHDITIKSNGAYLNYKTTDIKHPTTQHLITIIDTPGHCDFSCEVTAALHVTDGALVVVDCVEGFCINTKRVIRQALRDKIKPILTISKLDQYFTDSLGDGEAAYNKFWNIIKNTNVTIDTYKDQLLGDVNVDPREGSVAFSSANDGWSFRLSHFANMHAATSRRDYKFYMKCLWGDYYYDELAHEWTTVRTSPSCVRGFVKLCYDPIVNLIRLCEQKEYYVLHSEMGKFGATLTEDDMKLEGKNLMKRVMQKCFPVTTLLEMVISHLPSPNSAQKERARNLYTSSEGDIFAAIKDCDPHGPLMVYVSNMIPKSSKGRFFAFCRVFSGSISQNMRVKIMGPAYRPGKNRDLHHGIICMGQDNVPCGNIVALSGLDQYITKSATLTDYDLTDDDRTCHPMNGMRFFVAPVLRVSVKCKVSSCYRDLAEGMKYLEKFDPMVACTREDDRHICFIAGTGELHIRECIKYLQEFLMDTELEFSTQVVSYRETVVGQSCCELLSTGNNSIGLAMMVEPLEGNVKITARKGLCFEGIQDFVGDGFRLALEKGALAEEMFMDITFKLCKVVQEGVVSREDIVSAAKNVVQASQLGARPRLLKPFYDLEVLVMETNKAGVYEIFNKMGGTRQVDVQREDHIPGDPYYHIKAVIPVEISLGLAQALRTKKASAQMVFSHWAIIKEDPFVSASLAAEIVRDIRRFKNLDQDIPNVAGLGCTLLPEGY